MRFLVIGAGASIEEFNRVGGNPKECFPSIANFSERLFQESAVVQFVTAKYLEAYKMEFNKRILEAYNDPSNVKLQNGDMANSPLNVYLKLEKSNPEQHNVERLFEFAWNNFGKNNIGFWDELINWTIYQSLSIIHSKYFFEQGVGYKIMPAGALICSKMTSQDRVLSLNYDTCFDLALQQNFNSYCYAPNDIQDGIKLYKPHGSLSLFVNQKRGIFAFCAPDKVPGTISYPDPEGGEWHASLGILPPRLNKNYSQNPIAKNILKGIGEMEPEIVTLWGVGLTDSDIDLLAIYTNTCNHAKKVELISPSGKALNRSQKLLGLTIDHYSTIEEWLAKGA